MTVSAPVRERVQVLEPLSEGNAERRCHHEPASWARKYPTLPLPSRLHAFLLQFCAMDAPHIPRTRALYQHRFCTLDVPPSIAFCACDKSGMLH